MINSEKKSALINVERLIIYTVVLLVLVVFVLQTDYSILTIVPFTLLYFFIIIFNIILPFLKEKQQKNNLRNDAIFFSNTSPINVDKLKKIAAKNYYFDEAFFYYINDMTKKTIAIPFLDILEVTKTSTVNNNVCKWRVIAICNDKKVSYTFKHNYFFWNSNFPDFLDEVKRVNPKVNISTFNLWNK